MVSVNRVRKGVSEGGQFAAGTKTESKISLEQLREYAKPLPHPPGSRAVINGEFGTISGEPDPRGNLYVNLDGGGCIVAKPDKIANWDAWLDLEMPAIDYDNGDGPDGFVDPADADRCLHTNLTGLRGGIYSWQVGTGDYYRGRAAAHAEVAAALMNADADPETAQAEGRKLLDFNPGTLDRDHIRKLSAAPLTRKRTRRLAGYFTRRAAELTASRDETPEHLRDDTHQGSINVFAQAAVRLSDAAEERSGPGFSYEPYERRVLQQLDRGETDPGTIIATAWDDESW